MVDVIKELLHINGGLLLQRPRIRIKANISSTIFPLKLFIKNPSSACFILHLFHDDQKSNTNNSIRENRDSLSVFVLLTSE